MKTITKNIYTFSELSDEAKERAIHDHIEFEISEIGLREDDKELNPYYKYAVRMEEMQTPWFLHELIYTEAKDLIISTIEANGYEFDENGNIH